MVLSGAPEEWFALVLEAGMALWYGQLPAILNYSVMMQSIASKIGHSRSVDSRGGINHHADHHTLHRKNFGFGTSDLGSSMQCRFRSALLAVYTYAMFYTWYREIYIFYVVCPPVGLCRALIGACWVILKLNVADDLVTPGSNVIVDMLFETNSNNDCYEVGPYELNRAVAEGSDRVQFSFKRTGDAEIEGMLKAYRNPSLMQCLKVALGGHRAL